MKNKTEQPQHTQGENQIHSVEYSSENSIGANFKLGETHFFTTEHPTRSKPVVERIVKAVNMHDELIETLKFSLKGFQQALLLLREDPKEGGLEHENAYTVAIKKALKQAEQK